MQKIKIVVWDLDDTFWNGTLSEGPVSPREENLELVKRLTDNGIMNSISSKNDFDAAKAVLEKWGVWDYFIFPHINWESKGRQVEQILKDCSLRAENTLFLDDNPGNRQEVLFYNPAIRVADVHGEEDASLEALRNLKGSSDPQHNRLQQYKVLETKKAAAASFSSNEEFLRDSNIRVIIKDDCAEHFDRLLDLINRSNQLNYTKVRLTEEELRTLLADKNRKTGYVEVFDDYGEYGIVGFFSIVNGAAEHFTFSCRVIGMGIEQYVYAELGYPQVETKGEVRSALRMTGRPDWINRDAERAAPKKKRAETVIDKKLQILIDGGCDLEQMAAYLKSDNAEIKYHFNIGRIRHDNTYLWIGSREYSDQVKKELANRIPFIGAASFDNDIYDDKYDVVVLSILMDYTQAVYRSNTDNSVVITYGDYKKPLTPENFREEFEEKSAESFAYFFQNYSFVGGVEAETLFSHLVDIRSHIPQKTALIIINGCEVQIDRPWWEVGRYIRHREYNKIVDRFVEQSPNSYVLDMRKIVSDPSQFRDNIRHYSREVYYDMAVELSRLINSIENTNISAEKMAGSSWKWSLLNWRKWSLLWWKLKKYLLKFFYKEV